MKTIITTHTHTDFDALASVTAATLLYPDAIPVLPNAVNPNVKAFLSIHKDIFPWAENKKVDFSGVDRFIVVDTGSWKRLNHVKKLHKVPDLEIYLWDHHDQPVDISAIWKCHYEVGANITLMLRCLKAERSDITPIQATLMLTGLYEDTGHLTFSGTTAEDAYAAAYFLEKGADLAILNRFLRPAYGERQKAVLFEMLKSARRTNVNGYGVSFSVIEVEGHVESLALVVNMYRDIMNVDAAFGIFQLPREEKCMVIGRSDAEGINIGSIMRSLGGGGHPGAGSVLLRQVNGKAVKQMISELIRGNQHSSVRVSDLMSFPVISIDGDMPMKKAEEYLRIKGCTGLPVMENGVLVGILSRRDFNRLTKNNQLKAPVKAFMSRLVQTIEPDAGPLQAARKMVKHDIGRLPVVQDGRIIGIVTRSDVMHYFYDLLPD
jgi:nanoRNase/pAp phosphatase (c-di-AMP/oligoRNAs hydrolase)/CBS domain-containing protein